MSHYSSEIEKKRMENQINEISAQWDDWIGIDFEFNESFDSKYPLESFVTLLRILFFEMISLESSKSSRK